jgi:hypothetical protein
MNAVSTGLDSMPLYEAMIAVAAKRLSRAGLAGVFRSLFGL